MFILEWFDFYRMRTKALSPHDGFAMLKIWKM